MLDPRVEPARRNAGWVQLDQGRPGGRKKRVDPAQQQDGVAADSNVAVEQQRGPPATSGRHIGEDRHSHYRRAKATRRTHSGGGDVDTERRLPRLDQCDHMTAGTTTNIEYRSGASGQHGHFLGAWWLSPPANR